MVNWSSCVPLGAQSTLFDGLIKISQNFQKDLKRVTHKTACNHHILQFLYDLLWRLTWFYNNLYKVLSNKLSWSLKIVKAIKFKRRKIYKNLNGDKSLYLFHNGWIISHDIRVQTLLVSHFQCHICSLDVTEETYLSCLTCLKL